MNGNRAFDQKGNLIDEKFIKDLEKLWTAFKAWIEKHENLAVRPYRNVRPIDLEDSRHLQQ